MDSFRKYERSCSPAMVFLCLTAAAILICSAVDISADNTLSREIDVMLVIDLSGSMKPRGGEGRYDSLFSWMDAFVKPTDRVGVVSMGYGARLLMPLTPYSAVSFETMKSELQKREKYTDVAAGLESAYYQLKTDRDETKTRLPVILLFSDAQIDMPGGDWASRNSMRYLQESLKPALKNDGIRFLAIVPDGLNANFQLLHELSRETGGAYYRGLPSDATNARRAVDVASVTQAVKKPSENVALASSKENDKPKIAQAAASRDNTPLPKTVVVERVVREETGTWMYVLIGVGGVVLLALLGGVIFLFRTAQRERQADRRSDAEIEMVLRQVQAVQERSAERRSSIPSVNDIVGLGNDPDLDEKDEALSVNLVSPYLEFSDVAPLSASNAADDIAAAPAFSDNDDSGANMTVSNMETQLGTAEPDLEPHKE